MLHEIELALEKRRANQIYVTSIFPHLTRHFKGLFSYFYGFI